MKSSIQLRQIGLFLCFLSLNSLPALAQPVPELMKAIEDQIQTLDQTMNDGATTEVRSEINSSEGEMYFLQNFLVRVRARWGFDVPGFAKFQIVPEAEMLWQRTPPEGWTSYKP